MAKKSKKLGYIFAVGRRKTAVARVRLYRKPGEMVVNNLPVAQYFPGDVSKQLYRLPLEVTETEGKVSFSIKVSGSGKRGQLGAAVHGMARALSLFNREKYRKSLKIAGLLTRDPRTRERRKVGTGGKARRQKQSPKR